MRKTLFTVGILIVATASFSQCPVADFDIPSEVCIGENIKFSNFSGNAIRYEWDFCSGDLLSDPNPTAIELLESSALDDPFNIAIIEDNENYYGFSVSYKGSGDLVRFDFGESLSNIPNVVVLGNLNGLMVRPTAIEFLEEDGVWYGIAIGLSGGVYRLKFGSNLENQPIIEKLQVALNSQPRGLKIMNTESEVACVVSHFDDGKLTTLAFGASIVNIPTAFSYNIEGGVRTSAVDVYNACGEWYGIATDYGAKKVFLLKYGQSIGSQPSVDVIRSGSVDFGIPIGISVAQEANKVIAFVVNRNGVVYRIDFGEALNINPDITSLGNLGLLERTWGTAIKKEESVWHLFAVSTDSKIFRINFPLECPVNRSFDTLKNPQNIFFSQSGQYKIALKATDNTGLSSGTVKSIQVSNNTAPDINISISDNRCLNSNVSFTGSSSNISSISEWVWDFGDGTSAIGRETNHVYDDPGVYEIKLNIESNDGCKQHLSEKLIIYEKSAFEIEQSTVCTNSEIKFESLSNIPAIDALVSYKWLLDGEVVSDEKSLILTFDQPGSKDVSLLTASQGCTSRYDTTINVLQGPTVSFNVAQVCQGDPITFENLTTGENITGYTWDFGDGGNFSSTISENPTYTFDEPGTYLVSLSVTNELGCQNVYRQEVTVYEQPSVGFVSEVACVGTPTQFTDTTTAGTNANVIEWEWSFGDGGTANERNPAHAYSQPGTYEVQLITQTTAGCVDSAGQTVTVESPVAAGFVATPQCPTASANYRVLLSDTSVVVEDDNVNRWFWSIGNASFVTQNVEYSFPGPGTYPVTLTAFAASGCAATVTRSVVIDSLPTVAFTHPVACTGEPVAFQSEVSAGLTDYRWSFGEVGTAFEANPSFVFDAPGTYEVTLRAQTTAGCPFTATQSVTVTAAPVAAFEASATQGGAPLTVAFTNQSTDAVQYAWDFAGLGIFEEENPTFTFDEVGTYTVTLTATNTVGCVSTAAQTITVRDPVQDLRLEEISVVDNPNGAGQRLLLSVRNVGSLPADSVAIVIGFGDAVSVQEDLPQPLLAGETRVYVTQFILPKTPGSVRYLCATLTIGDTDFIDASPADNRNCVSLDEQLSTEAPFPNPVRDQLQLPVILPQGDAVSLRLVDSRGQTMRTYRQPNAPAGLNTFVIPTKGLPVGTYLLQMTYRGEQRQWRVGVEP